jgi:hypothetical protein
MDESFPPGMLDDIARFFADEARREPGLDLYPDVFETAYFFPLQRKGELAAMMRLARSVQPKVVMEIGADKGGGLYHWCKCLPSVQRVVACEVRGLPYAPLFEKKFPHLSFLWLHGSSYDPGNVRRVAEWLSGDQINCLFLDGDKGAFLDDFRAYVPLANGLVFVHDIQDPAPGAAFKSMTEGRQWSTIFDRADSHWAMERASRGIPPASAHEAWLRHWEGRSCGVGVLYLKEKANGS